MRFGLGDRLGKVFLAFRWVLYLDDGCTVEVDCESILLE